MVECCANCKHCVSIPKNNRYGDMEYFCLATGYFTHGVKKDRNKLKHFTPGGKELECKYEPKNVVTDDLGRSIRRKYE